MRDRLTSQSSPDAEDLGATDGAGAVRSGSAVLQDDSLRVLNLPLLSALETVRFHDPSHDSALSA